MSSKSSLKLIGKKRGMIQLFNDQGNAVACTVIEVEPNVVTQIKTVETDGYSALQIGAEKIITNDPRTIQKRAKKPLFGHYKKAGVEPRRYLTEVRLNEVGEYSLGQELNADIFSEIEYLDATAVSKGKGYQGVIKLHNFSGGPASHGSSFHRHAGSTGMRSTPGRCLPGGPRASHMGLEVKTVQNLKVIKIEDNLVIVEGQVPGPRNGLVYIAPAKKLVHKKKQ